MYLLASLIQNLGSEMVKKILFTSKWQVWILFFNTLNMHQAVSFLLKKTQVDPEILWK